MPVGISAHVLSWAIQCHDKKPKIAAEQPFLDPRNNT